MATLKSAQPRFHFMDTARALCMVLGIPYHAALLYAAGAWRIHSPEESFAAELIARASQSFRMPTFFMISGFFAAMMLMRRPARQWISNRFVRLMIPLFFTALLINPLMIFAEIAGDGTIASSEKVSAFLRSISKPSNLIAHLWFLAALMWMCLVAAAATSIGKLVPKFSGKVMDVVHSAWFGPLLILGMIIWEAFVKDMVITSGIPLYAAFALVNVPAFLQYFPYFLFGCLLFLNADFRDRFLDLTAVSVAGGVIGLSLYCIYPQFGKDWAYGELVKPVCAILVSRFSLGVLKRYADRENALVRRIVDRSFTIYLVHMPFIVVLGLVFLHIQMPPFLEFLIISAITFAFCYSIAGIVERCDVLRFMFNGIKPRREVLAR